MGHPDLRRCAVNAVRTRGAGETIVRPVTYVSIKTIQLALIMLADVTIPASAQSIAPYPAEPIRIVVPFGPAGGPDFAIRALQPTLQELLKQSIRVENRPGANS